MIKKIIFTVMLVGLLAFVTVMAFSQTSQNIRWEYLSERISYATNSGRQRLNDLGNEGWELIAVEESNVIFKRRLP